MVNKNNFVFVVLATVLLSSILSLSYQDVDATSLKDIGNKIKRSTEKMKDRSEDSLDCMKYNSFMSQKAMKEGKTFHPNPDCDPDEQWKYDRLNSGELSDAEMESILKNEAYNNKDNDEKYKDLEESSLDFSNDEDEDYEKKNDKPNKLSDIGNEIKNLFK